MKLKIYIPTCDDYLWLIKPFMFLFNKFWDNSIQVIYLGYNPPDFNLPITANGNGSFQLSESLGKIVILAFFLIQ